MAKLLSHDDYHIVWIAVLAVEAEAALGVLEQQHDGEFPAIRGDDYLYFGGDINGHNVVVATLPEGQNYGVGAAAALASHVKSRFPNIWFALLVGVAAGLPNLISTEASRRRDIRLGDVLVVVPDNECAGIIQYDLGRVTDSGFQINNRHAETPAIVRSAIRRIKLTMKRPFKQGTRLAETLTEFLECDEEHTFARPPEDSDCLTADSTEFPEAQEVTLREPRDREELVRVWYGRLGSGNSLMRSSRQRNELRDTHNLIGLEMEAAGVMNILPTAVVRGVCDYGNHLKNKLWQPYAAAVAAVYAKGILCTLQPQPTQGLSKTISADRIIIPFRQDADFVDRPEILGRVGTILFNSAGRAALLGMAGVGKSQLAIEYAFRLHKQNPQRWIFWVHASTPARFSQDYHVIADKLKLPGRENANQDVLQLVCDWLRDERNGNWLLILDNADDARMFRKGETTDGNDSNPSLCAYVPQSRNGSVLVTSRLRDAAICLVGRSQDIIKVEPMDEDHAVELLKTKLDKSATNEADLKSAVVLVRELGCLPLAIAQAAAYINQRAPRSSVSKYLTNFQMNDLERVRLLNIGAVDLRRDEDTLNSILNTWQISFEYVRGSRPSAALLLSLMSCCDRQRIPEFLLLSYFLRPEFAVNNKVDKPRTDVKYEIDGVIEVDKGEVGLPGWKTSSEREKDTTTSGGATEMYNGQTFEDDIAMLSDFCLISTTETGDIFQMHALVQLATHKWLEAKRELTEWREALVMVLDLIFPQLDLQDWTKFQELLPHVELLEQQSFSKKSRILDLASLLMKAGRYSNLVGMNNTAERLLLKSVEITEGVLGPQNIRTMDMRSKLAEFYTKMFRYKQAEVLCLTILQDLQSLNDEKHWLSLDTKICLARALAGQNHLEEAENIYRYVLDCDKSSLDAEDRRVPTSTWLPAELAEILSKQGRYVEAETMTRQSLVRVEELYGSTHHETLICMLRLALVHYYSGKYREAADLQRKILFLREQKLGASHPGTVTASIHLAVSLIAMGCDYYSEAEAFLRNAVLFLEEMNGLEDIILTDALGWLGTCLASQDRLDEAEQFSRRALAVSSAILGDSHPDTLAIELDLAYIERRRGQLDEAEDIL